MHTGEKVIRGGENQKKRSLANINAQKRITWGGEGGTKVRESLGSEKKAKGRGNLKKATGKQGPGEPIYGGG